MRDRLEEHIVENKDLLDVYDPPGDLLWQRIDRDMRPRKLYLYRASRWVASAVILIGLSYFGISQWSGDPLPVVSQEITISDLEQDEYSADIAKIESYYISVINAHKEQLLIFKEEGLEVDESFFVDLDNLQELYSGLQKELAYGEDKDVVIDAMVKNLMTQLEILGKQVKILENIKKVRNEKELQI